jgi:hypothetical protein
MSENSLTTIRRTSELRRDANLYIRLLSRPDDAGERVSFFCECGAGGCCASVAMTSLEYDQRWRHGNDPLLAAGHVPVDEMR